MSVRQPAPAVLASEMTAELSQQVASGDSRQLRTDVPRGRRYRRRQLYSALGERRSSQRGRHRRCNLVLPQDLKAGALEKLQCLPQVGRWNSWRHRLIVECCCKGDFGGSNTKRSPRGRIPGIALRRPLLISVRSSLQQWQRLNPLFAHGL